MSTTTGMIANAVAVLGSVRVGEPILPIPVWITAPGLLAMLDEGQPLNLRLAAAHTDTFTVSAGSLPSGVTLASNGLLAGTPNVATSGAFNFTVRAANQNEVGVERSFSLYINDVVATNSAPVWQTAPNLGTYAETTNLAIALIATDAQPISYSLVSGALPSGLTLSGGTVSGVLSNVLGTTISNFTIRASDGSLSSDRAFSLTVTNVNVAPVWQTPSGSIGSFNEGSAALFTFVATDEEAVSYVVQSGALPPGFDLNSSTGVLGGTAEAVAQNTTYNFTLRASDGTLTADRAFSITVRNVNTAPVWVTPVGTLGSINEGTTYALSVLASDDAAVTEYTLASGSIPGGTLNTTTGSITGVAPIVVNDTTYSFIIRASDAQGLDTLRSFSITVLDQNEAPVWTTAAGTIAALSSNAIANIQLVATDDDAVTSYAIVSGSLPNGLSLNTTTGRITGTAPFTVTSTDYSFTVRASDGTLSTDRTFIIRVLAAYTIANSVYTQQTQNFARSGFTNFNNQRFTASFWFKQRAPSTANRYLFWNGSTATTNFFLYQDSSSRLAMWINGASNARTFTPALLDTNAWMHVVMAVDTTQAQNADRVRMWLNGVEVTSTTGGTITQNSTMLIRNSHNWFHSTDTHLADIRVIDGLQVQASEFGEFDPNGVWQPKSYAGSFGASGYHLDMADTSSVAALGIDRSGNGLNFTPGGSFSVSGTSSSVTRDSPTQYDDGTIFGRGNYPTIVRNGARPDPAPTISYSEGGMRVSASSASSGPHAVFPASIVASRGKFYFEMGLASGGAASQAWMGLLRHHTMAQYSTNSHSYAFPTAGISHSDFAGFRIVGSLGAAPVTVNGGAPVGSAGVTDGDTFGFAVDLTLGRMWVSRNGTWVTGDPATNSSPLLTFTPNAWSPVFGIGGNTTNSSIRVNFGAHGSFASTPPAGFLAMNSLNVQSQQGTVISRPSDFFSTVTYTGTGAVQTVQTGFSPSLVWIRGRGANSPNVLFDTNRGSTRYVTTDGSNTVAEITNANSLTGFGDTGFTIGSAPVVNASASTYAAWAWRESTTAGVDVVSFTTTASGSTTINHSLGVTPAFYMVKNLTTGEDWHVHHGDLGNSRLRFTNAAASGSFPQVPNSTTFRISAPAGTNNYIAYLFAAVPGYSAFGSYQQLLSTDSAAEGPYVLLGFRPRFFMWKANAASNNWHIVDTVRSTTNSVGVSLQPDTQAAEGASVPTFDFFSNGFKVRGTAASNNRLFWAAFADSSAVRARLTT